MDRRQLPASPDTLLGAFDRDGVAANLAVTEVSDRVSSLGIARHMDIGRLLGRSGEMVSRKLNLQDLADLFEEIANVELCCVVR